MAMADDIKCPPAGFFGSGSSALVARGKLSTAAIKNFIGTLTFPFSDTISGDKTIDVVYVRTTPSGDATLAVLPIGSMAVQLEITSTAVSGFGIWFKTAAGATGWTKVATPSHLVKFAGVATCANSTLVTNGVLETILCTGVLATDSVFVQIKTQGTDKSAVVLASYSTANNIIAVLSTVCASGVLKYEVARANA